jgi:hypothetical protein
MIAGPKGRGATLTIFRTFRAVHYAYSTCIPLNNLKKIENHRLQRAALGANESQRSIPSQHQ